MPVRGGGSKPLPGWPIALIAALKISAKSAPECPFECGGGCKSYLGNAQMPVTLFIMVLPLGWSVLKDWCVDHPPGADRTTCPVRTGPRVQMGRYVQSIYRGPVCVTEVGYRVRGGKSDRTGSKISSTYRGPVCVLGARSCRGPVCHQRKRKNSASSGRLV